MNRSINTQVTIETGSEAHMMYLFRNTPTDFVLPIHINHRECVHAGLALVEYSQAVHPRHLRSFQKIINKTTSTIFIRNEINKASLV